MYLIPFPFNSFFKNNPINKTPFESINLFHPINSLLYQVPYFCEPDLYINSPIPHLLFVIISTSPLYNESHCFIISFIFDKFKLLS